MSLQDCSRCMFNYKNSASGEERAKLEGRETTMWRFSLAVTMMDRVKNGSLRGEGQHMFDVLKTKSKRPD